MKKIVLFVIGLLAITSLACGFNFSTANITSAITAYDAEGTEPTTVYGQEDTFYAVVELANAPDETAVKAVWTAIEAEGIEPGLMIDEVTVTGGDGRLQFDLTNDKLWPVGTYKVDLYLNDEQDRTLEFTVEGAAVAAEPTPEPEPTATPEPEPTDTPEPVEEEPTSTPAASAGDTLGGGSSSDEEEATEEDTSTAEESEPVALPLEDYTHPSGAFSIGVPETWELVDEDEISAAFGDRQSRVGVAFVNVGETLDEEDIIEFAANSVDIIAPTFSDQHEIVAENNKLEESGFLFLAVDIDDGSGTSDFFVEQIGTVMYILYFASLDYEAMDPTWSAIIDSYFVDAEAAAEADPVEVAAPPTATPVPAPAANPYAPPPGVARVYLENYHNNEYNIDFGDGSGSIKVLPGAENFYHDVAPGKFNPGLSLPGGGATNIEFEITADQAWVILVTETLDVKWGQVYP